MQARAPFEKNILDTLLTIKAEQHSRSSHVIEDMAQKQLKCVDKAQKKVHQLLQKQRHREIT